MKHQQWTKHRNYAKELARPTVTKQSKTASVQIHTLF